MKKIDVDNKTNKYYVIIVSICIIALATLLVFAINQNIKQYLVDKGTLEYTEISTGYIVKNEKTIQKDQSKVIVPVIAEGAKVAKGDVIATYKGEEFANYEETLTKMDKEILERMQELPVVYSSEVDAIESTIRSYVKESIEETSYNKMQEYKQKINSNISKRANIIGKLSPDGAEIKQLIDKRNKYEESAKKSNDNILAPMTGLVSYVTDGLEDNLTTKQIDKIEYKTIKDSVIKEHNVDNSKIKIVNNYEAYIILKSSLDNLEYMQEGCQYRLKLMEQDNVELLATLYKIKKVEDGVEVYFKVTNGIEYIIDLRQIEIEVVWGYAEGLIIPTNTLYKFENKDIYYVSCIRHIENEKIPVKVKLKNDKYAVVTNYTADELKELQLTSEYDLSLYDKIIIESKK